MRACTTKKKRLRRLRNKGYLLGKLARIARNLAAAVCCACALCVCAGALAGCGGSSGNTSGPAYTIPESITTATFNASAAKTQNGASIDTSSVAQGYVGVSATNSNRLKFQVNCGQASYNYDLPGDGTAIICPLNMGDGSYTFRVMQNTSGSSYVEIASVTASVSMESEFAPYVRPNVYVNYDENSQCVAKARELAQGAENQGDVALAVFNWITENISYDTAKAQQLADASGYIPNPDETLEEGSGICLDYASLGAAMLRSLGIPCKVITGYVSPDGIYHAWNLIYLDGEVQEAHIRVDTDTWSLIDMTFASAGQSSTVGDGSSYTERNTY